MLDWNNIIARIETMIVKEENHLNWLKNQKQTDYIISQIIVSKAYIAEFNKICNAYKEYIKNESN